MTKFFKRLKRAFSYFRCGWKTRDFDYWFEIELEEKKLREMYEYFSHSDLTESDATIAKEIKLALSLIDIISEEDSAITSVSTVGYNYIPTKYVNTKNASRFFDSYTCDKLLRLQVSSNAKDRSLSYVYYDELRIEKAWHLYNMLREMKMRNWWN